MYSLYMGNVGASGLSVPTKYSERPNISRMKSMLAVLHSSTHTQPNWLPSAFFHLLALS